jgi:phenylalanyl-tRNA synthetase beta chain
MKVSLNWLKELVDFDKDAASLSELLTKAGVEVEGIESKGAAFPHVVVAQILASEQHPNADRLSVCRVDDGSGTPLQIVCGAKNYKVGDKVPLARAGAVLPGNFEIRVGKLRGVDSQGMLCSADELGLAENSEGLLILDAAATVGVPLEELFPADTVLDLEITPNRPDLLCHKGIAREVAALLGKPWKSVHEFVSETAYIGSVSVLAAECSLYSVCHLTGVKVAPSPSGLRQRLEAVGVRSINNVVDITNWVMLELGQPLHAFDTRKLNGGLRVRFAQDGESFQALDGKVYKLASEDLVIADDSGPVALAGIMGGASTAVDEHTVEVSLESAVFDAAHIRRTSRRLGLSSESSYRFERGVDVAGVFRASQRAAGLLQELAHAVPGDLSVASGNAQVDIAALLMGLTPVRHVDLRLERITALLGAPVAEARVEQILSALGLSRAQDGWEVPSHRGDLTREVDLIEEIARIVGIEHFPPGTKARFSASSQADHHYDKLMQLRRRAVAQGLFEARSLTLVSERMGQVAFPQEEILRVKNPLNEDQVVLRPAIVPGLLDAATRNARAGVKDVRLFEVGRTFAHAQVEERMHVGIVIAGPAWTPNWRSASVPDADLFNLKGMLAVLLNAKVDFEQLPASDLLGVAVRVLADGKPVGIAGQVRPSEAKARDLVGTVIAAEISLETFLLESRRAPVYVEVDRFPAVTRDMALVAGAEVTHEQILAVLKGAQEPLLRSVELFDVFCDATGQRVPVGSKSLGYSLTYRSAERTLTANEVNTAHTGLKQRVTAQLGVQARE